MMSTSDSATHPDLDGIAQRWFPHIIREAPFPGEAIARADITTLLNLAYDLQAALYQEIKDRHPRVIWDRAALNGYILEEHFIDLTRATIADDGFPSNSDAVTW